MTGLAQRRPGAALGAWSDRRQRIRQLVRTELLLLRRFHVLTATAIITVGWSLALAAAPAEVRLLIAPFVLLMDVTALGFLFVPALLVLERMEGVEGVLRMTPTTLAERVGVRVGLTTALSLVATMVIVVGSGLPLVVPRLLGVTTMGVLFGLVATGLVGGAATLTTFLVRAPLVAVPLIAPALAYLLGLTDAPVLYVSPVTAAVDLLSGRMHWFGLAWQVVWIFGWAVVISRHGYREPVTPRIDVVRRSRPVRRHPGAYAWWTAVGSFARTDRRTLLRDGLFVMLVGSVPLVALIMRVIGTVGVDWTQRRYGVALAPYLPLVQVVLLTVHTPVIFGAMAGLLLLEDHDAGLFRPLAATRATVATLLAYRLAASVVVTTATLAFSLGFTGVGHAAGVAGRLSTALAAGIVSVIPALLVASLAANRVQGIAVMKVISLPLYLPIATWFVTAHLRWLFAPLPTAWAVWAAWAPTATRALAFTLGALVVTAGFAVPLGRRFLRGATDG